MKNTTIKIFSSIEELSNDAAEYLLNKINRKKPGSSFSIAISGGSTPKKIFQHIVQYYSTSINWDTIKIFFGDERCVPPDDYESNFKMANDNLFEPENINSENIYRIKGEDDPEIGAKRYSEVLKNNILLKNGVPQFDLIMLGLGEDGHTASIFPNQIDIFHSNNFCEVALHPESGQKRITLTGTVINNAKVVVFIVTGSKKSKIVADILSSKKVKSVYPASLVNPSNGKLVWMLDKDAAQLLDEK